VVDARSLDRVLRQDSLDLGVSLFGGNVATAVSLHDPMKIVHQACGSDNEMVSSLLVQQSKGIAFNPLNVPKIVGHDRPIEHLANSALQGT
jgi:hypothetical protein